MSFAARVIRTTTGTASAWSPSAFSPSAWWVSDEPTNTLSGDVISSWADKSGNGLPATATGNAQGRVISSVLNSRSVVRGQASDNYNARFSFGNFGLTNGVAGATMAILHKPLANNGSSGDPMMAIDIGGVNYGRIYLGRGDFGSGAVYGGGRRLDGDAGSWCVDNTDYAAAWLICIVVNDYANAVSTMTVNGKATVVNPFQVAGLTSATNSYGHSFGHQDGASQDHYLAEGLVLNRAISASERQQLEGYIAWSWGMQASLIAGHPYKSSPP